jgi:serine/threonine protein kinase
MDNLIGKTIDSYKIVEVIGGGGMGIVYKAIDTNLDKIVALKMIAPFLAKDENFLKRFKTEAKSLARLEDKNIVNVYALRETEYGLFMVMEYVHAKTISEWLREKGKFTVKETIEISRQILHAINCVHKANVIHRDIKPNNILLTDEGVVKVMDFGLAKVVQEQGSQVTVTQTAAGTLYYMSPEQVKGSRDIDRRTDIYSLGMTIYEMLTGRNPFEKSESEFSIQKRIVEGKIPSPKNYNAGIPGQLIKFILKAIEKDPDKRFQNISEMEEALSKIEYQKNDDVTKVVSNVYQNNVDGQSTAPPPWRKTFIYASSIVLIAAIIITYFLLTKDGIHETGEDKDTLKTVVNKKDVLPIANLTIKTDPPGAAVFINGEMKGRTELKLDSLENKNYLIALRLSGYEEWSSNYKVFPGSNTISENLKKIPIAVNSTLTLQMDEPGEIYINNNKFAVSAGKTVSESVTPGKHTIKFISNNGTNKTTTIDVGKNETKNLTCYFQQSVSIQTLDDEGNSIWASIILDDKVLDVFTPREISLPSGPHKIFVKKSGYKILEEPRSINITPSYTKKATPIVFHLKKM